MNKEQILALAEETDDGSGEQYFIDQDGWITEFATKLLESYKAELLKEVGEPVLYAEFAEDGGWLGDASEYADHLEEPHALFTSDQVAAAIAKATKPLEYEKETWKAKAHESANQFVDFMHKEHSELATERDELRTQLAAAQEECEFQRNAHKQAEELMLEQSNQLAAEQLNNKLLREALAKCRKAICFPETITYPVEINLIDKAISTPASTEALDKYVDEKVKELQTELETERMRLAGCGVAALGYFDGCADEYRSASLDETLRLYSKYEHLTARVRELEEENAELHEQVDMQIPKLAFAQLQAKLAASQAYAEQLRVALEAFAYRFPESQVAKEALAITRDTSALHEYVKDIESSRDWYKRRVDLLQEWQSKMRDPERTIVCDIIANGLTMPEGGRYEVDTSALDAYVAEKVKESHKVVPREGLVPHAYQLEATHNNAEYWYKWGHSKEAAEKGESVICMAQAVFAWRNAAYAKAEEVESLTRQRDLAVESLENCRLLAARHRKEEWAGHIMRFCKDAGLSGSPIRNDAIKESEA